MAAGWPPTPTALLSPHPDLRPSPATKRRVLPACSHAFHSECLDPWLQSKAVCPVCRAQVEPPGKAAGEASGSAVGAAAASGSTAAATGSAAAEPLPSDDAA